MKKENNTRYETYKEYAYGKCSECKVNGLRYQKHIKNGYWINYLLCPICKKIFNLHILNDERSPNSTIKKPIGLTSTIEELEQKLKLIGHLLEKLYNKSITEEELKILKEWLNKQ
jgi:ssDNA-binding Zn-finger/Zn-ribbon topoisomerase 1